MVHYNDLILTNYLLKKPITKYSHILKDWEIMASTYKF